MKVYIKICISLFLLFNAFTLTVLAQHKIPVPEVSNEYSFKNNDGQHPCITPSEYLFIEKEIAENCRLLHINNTVQHRPLSTALNWPLRAAAGLTNCSYYAITAHVDQDPAAGTFKDYNCGSIAYDTHTGTDIAIYPFSFLMMDNNQVEVIAAAAGTIVGRADGNFDRNCSSNNLPANYIIVQHADGSNALYWHMKKNSVTSKIVGQTVAAGEYLGVVGSSGSASGPHLHFEVWTGNTVSTMIDPFSGTCNLINASTWWASQKPYTEPSVLKASVHTTDVVFPGCPTTETSNESTSYTIPFQGSGLPPNAAKFYIFLRNETSGLVANMSILNPNSTVFTSWSITSSVSHVSSYWGWTKNLPLTAGTYTFKAVYNGITCSQTFDIITSGCVATITASGPTTFCQGDSVILTASTGASYLWSNGLTTKSITVKTAASYTVKVTCQDASSATSAATVVTVNSLPTATISTSGSTTFCQGDSVILTSTVGSSYLWSNGSTTRSITLKTAGNYSVKVTGANGCSATSSITSVIVNSLPTATISTSGSTTFCQGDSVILTSSIGNSYLWSNGSTTRSITVKTAGNYSVKVTAANGCSATSSITSVIVNSLPTATISTSGSTTFCQGDSVILTSTVGSSYLWSNGSTSRSITVKTAGNYSVKVTGANGCSATSAITSVIINSLPTATISASGSTTFCQGDSVILTSSVGSSYLWSNGSTSRSITVKTAGNYSVKVTGANGCSATSSITSVIVNSLPTATISTSGSTTFCQGDSVILTSTVGSSYLWSNGSTSRSITVKTAGNYSVKVTGANGCSATSAITTVTVNSSPTATISTSGSTTFCQGDSVILTSTVGSSYLWSNGLTSRSITVKTAGNYSVKVTAPNGCSATSAITTVTVNSLPTATISTSGSTTFCQGDSVILTSSVGSSYLWSNASTSRSITVKTAGNYSVKVTGANGCSATSAITSVIVNSLPTATISASGSTTFCQGDSVILTSSVGSSYLWSNASTSRSITVKIAGNFSVKVTDANGCSATSAITTVVIHLPQNGLSIQLRNDTLFTPYNATNYWYLTGTSAPFDSGSYYKCRQTGNYFAEGRDVNGCLATSVALFVNCDLTGIIVKSNESQLNVYPNPANSILNIDWTNTENDDYSFVLINSLGQMVINEKENIINNSLHKIISTGELSDGIYILIIESKKMRKTIKVNKLTQ
ncbi:MAG: hypothetical protein JWN78_1346 [Bacteroidota bacterium]|nr:hypothetical protein [Bacteroidota bacterium]